MMEAPKFVPASKDCLITHSFAPNFYPELPYHLRKDVLQQIGQENGYAPESLWNQRGDWIEKRVAGLLSKVNGVSNIKQATRNSEEDADGKDVEFDYPCGKLAGQSKSSRYGIAKFKQEIRDAIPSENPHGQLLGSWAKEAIVNETLTRRGIILVNGSETKSDEEILNESIYPQLNRIIWHRAIKTKNRLWRKSKKHRTPVATTDGQLDLRLAV